MRQPQNRLVKGGTGLIQLDALTNRAVGAYVNDATVTAQLQRLGGEEVLPETPMPYVTGSGGRYQLTVPATVTDTLVVGEVLVISVLVTLGTGEVQPFSEMVRVIPAGANG